MNMKKTMAAIAAGAVAVSAMATTVSAATLETKTLTYNLVQTIKQSGDATVKLTAKFYNVPLVTGKQATFSIKNLGEKDIVRISGVYIEDNKQIVPIVGTKDKEQGGIYSPAVDAKITAAADTGLNGTIVVDIVDSNSTNPFALMGGTEAVAGTAAVPDTNAAITNGAGATGMGTAPTVVATTGQAKLNAKATDNITVTASDDGTNQTLSVVVGTAPAVTKSVSEMADEYGITVTFAGSQADNGKTFTISKFVAGTPAVDATPANNVSANITVEITKKELSKFVTKQSDGTFKTANGNEILKELKECSKELGAGASSIFGAGLAIPGDYTATSTDMTVSDHTTEAKSYKYPYKSSLNNYLYKATGLTWDLTGGDAHGGDVLNHIYTVSDTDDSKKINPISVQAVINDAIAKHGEVTFVFNTATKKVAVQADVHNVSGSWQIGSASNTIGHWGNPVGSYVDNDWDACSVADFTSFGNHYYNSNQAGYDPNTTYILNNWLGDNLFNGSLIVNSNLTLALNDTQKFDWTSTSLSFTWEAIQDEALTTNQYANYIQNMVLRTSADWYWDNMQVILGETEVEEVESGAPVEGDVEDLPEDEEETDLGASEEEEEEEEEESEPEPEPEVAPAVETNPGTGNAPVALAVIPVALAAAAIVAKKRG